VTEALTRIGVDRITVSEVRRQGKQQGQIVVFRGATYKRRGDFLPEVKLEICVPDFLVHQIVKEVIRTRNGDRGEDAL
jgi:nitrogen regulatory protein P-II 1